MAYLCFKVSTDKNNTLTDRTCIVNSENYLRPQVAQGNASVYTFELN